MVTDESPLKDTSLERFLRILDKSEAITKSREAVEEVRRLRNEWILMEEKYKADIRYLQGQLQVTQKELAKYKAMSIEFAGKQFTLEEFEKNIHEQTQKAYRLEISNQVEAILRDEASWPQWFAEHVTNRINDGIKRGLDDTYWGNLRAAIAQARSTEWPKYLDEYTRKKITPFCQSSIRNLLATLSAIQVQKKCDKCGKVWFYGMQAETIAYLLNNPNIPVDCGDSQCRDWVVRHKLFISLGDVIKHLAMEPTMPLETTN